MVAAYVKGVTHERDVKNGLTTTNQGGEAYAIDELRQLRRFLILGSEGGTFYVSEKELTNYNIKAVSKALDAVGTQAIDEIVAISQSGRAPKNDPALLALAIAASYTSKDAQRQNEIRQYALANLSKVARTGTHLFHFAMYAEALRGWGPSLRKGVARWYTDRSALSLAQQVTKYAQRDGWSHRDLLRLVHPQAKTDEQNAVFKYVTSKGDVLPTEIQSKAIEYLQAVEAVKRAKNSQEVISLINQYNLPREVIPTTQLTKEVWEALLYAGDGMPIMALTRNLATLTRLGILAQRSDAEKFIVTRLGDQAEILKSRTHPIDFLKARMTYETGQSQRGNSTWTPLKTINRVLDMAFEKAFGNVEPTNKSLMLALDVSGSMTVGESSYWGSYGGGLAGVQGLSPRIASGAVAMITAHVEPYCEIYGFSHKFIDLNINSHDSLPQVLEKISNIPFGGTDCSLPMRYAQQSNAKFDAFIVYTDSETGGSNPSASIRAYRKSSGIGDAKLIVNAMTANRFSIADPSDANMLDVVGFDTAAPQVMSEFILNRV